MGYARGKRAFGFCDRTGRRYKLVDLIYEVRDGQRTGLRIGRDQVDPDHPQNFIGTVRTDDPQGLRDPRPEASLASSRALWGWRPVGHPEVFLQAQLGEVEVST